MRFSLLSNAGGRIWPLVSTSIKGVCCILLMLGLTACQSLAPQASFKQTREQQQLHLAQLLESLWQRAHVIPNLEQGAPLVSTAKAGQEAIYLQNEANIQRAQVALAEVDRRVANRKAQPQTGDLARLVVSDIRDNQQHAYSAPALVLYRAEQATWQLTASGGHQVLLDVVWNEQGTLYIEGQEVMNVSASSSDVPRTMEVFYYAGNVLAQAAFTFDLQVSVPRLETNTAP